MRPQVRILSLRPGAKIVYRKMNEQPIYLVAPPTGKVALTKVSYKEGMNSLNSCKLVTQVTLCRNGGMADALDSKSSEYPSCGFKSHFRHHLRQLQQIQTSSLCYRFESDFMPCGVNSSIGRAKLVSCLVYRALVQ